MNDVPGYRLTAVYGEVFGLTGGVWNLFSYIGASMRTVVGDEAGGYTKLFTSSPGQAVARLKDAAREHGSNALISVRVGANELGGMLSEVVAHGTSATAERIL